MVTNVMLTGLSSHIIAKKLNEWLVSDDNAYGSLVEVSDHAGGTKALETHVYLGAFNYLDINGFVKAYQEAVNSFKFRFDYQRSGIQLFIQRQDDVRFEEVDKDRSVKYHYRDSSQDVGA